MSGQAMKVGLREQQGESAGQFEPGPHLGESCADANANRATAPSRAASRVIMFGGYPGVWGRSESWRSQPG